jgi:Zn-dependent peptidase ImmA (M78 family)
VLHVLGADCGFCCRPGDIADVAVAAQRKRELARQERHANAFASELLMPELLVHEQARATGRNLSAMAERFDVSVPAIRLRLLTLGLLPAWMASVPVVGKEGRR